MSQNFRIALRFLTAKKRAMVMSLSCIILGVGLFIVTQAATSGFQEFFIKTILGTDGAIRIEDKVQQTLRSLESGSYNSGYEFRQKEGAKYIEGIDYPNVLGDGVKTFRNVAGVSAVLRETVIIRSSFRDQTGQAYGINIDDHLKVSDLGTQIVQGSIDNFRVQQGGVLIGKVIADKLQLEVGDTFEIEDRTELHHFRVAGAAWNPAILHYELTQVSTAAIPIPSCRTSAYRHEFTHWPTTSKGEHHAQRNRSHRPP